MFTKHQNCSHKRKESPTIFIQQNNIQVVNHRDQFNQTQLMGKSATLHSA